MKGRWPSPWIWVILAVLFIIIHIFVSPRIIRSSPEFSQVLLFLKSNSILTNTFGSIQSIQLDDINNEVNWNTEGAFQKNTCTGTYQFKVVGAKRSGVILVHWKSTSDHNTNLVSIDEVTSTENRRSTIWRNSEGGQ